MSGPWNFAVQQEFEQQPLNMALLLLQQELAELGSGVPSGRQITRDEQLTEGMSQKYVEPTVYIKEEPQSQLMDYQYPAVQHNMNMVPQAWPLSQPLHLQRPEQTFPDFTEKIILNLMVVCRVLTLCGIHFCSNICKECTASTFSITLKFETEEDSSFQQHLPRKPENSHVTLLPAFFFMYVLNCGVLFDHSFFQDDIKAEVTPVKNNVYNADSNQTSEYNKYNVHQYPSDSVCRNEMYSKRMCTTENLYHLSSIPYPDPSTWYSVKSFAGKETVNRWDVQAENTRHCNDTFVDRSVPSHIMSGQNSLQGEVVHGPMAHPDQIPPICQVCGKGFGSKEQLLNHMMVHRNRKPHVCEICEKSFCSPGNLKTHIMIHTGQKPHSCEKCGKRFTTLGNLKTHSVVHTAEKPHACQVCGKGFTTLGNLKTHLLIHTGERPYVCEVCGKRFTTRGNVKAHSVTHTAEKPFICHVCGKNFSHKGNLKTHIVSRHMANKPRFDCVLCGRNFVQAETLNTHIALVHAATSVPLSNLQDELEHEKSPVYLLVKV